MNYEYYSYIYICMLMIQWSAVTASQTKLNSFLSGVRARCAELITIPSILIRIIFATSFGFWNGIGLLIHLEMPIQVHKVSCFGLFFSFLSLCSFCRWKSKTASSAQRARTQFFNQRPVLSAS